MTNDDNSPARRRKRGQATSSMQPRFPSNRENRDASKSGDCVSEPETRAPFPTEDPGPSEAEVFKAFTSWRLRENPDAWVGTVDGQNINPYEDAFVISPNGRRRSNQLRLTKGEKGIEFAPSMMSVEAAYRELVSDTGSYRRCEG